MAETLPTAAPPDAWDDDDGELAPPTQFTLQVAPAEAGDRLDRYVARQAAALSRSYVRQLIDAGHILLNGAPTRPAQVVRPGDGVLVQVPPPTPTALVPEHLPLTIVYEDATTVVVDKPAGMVVHPAPGHASGTLVNALLARYPDMHTSGTTRPGIVHRLDQGTSGLLVVARTDAAMQALQAQQQARTMGKRYLALVEGPFREPAGLIDAPIGRHPTDRLRQAVVATGRAARTRYQVREPLGAYTLLELTLETGRTHQIRVHLAARNRPVVGDPLYGPRRPRASFGLQRQFLHAYRLGFVLPSTGDWREFAAPLPPDLVAALAKARRQAGG